MFASLAVSDVRFLGFGRHAYDFAASGVDGRIVIWNA